MIRWCLLGLSGSIYGNFMLQGEYKLVNGYLDAEHPPFFVDSTWYWKIRLHIINSKTKEEYGCIYVEGKFFKMLN